MAKVFLSAILIVMLILTGITLLIIQSEKTKLELERNELLLKNDSLHIQQLVIRTKLTDANRKIDSLLSSKKQRNK